MTGVLLMYVLPMTALILWHLLVTRRVRQGRGRK